MILYKISFLCLVVFSLLGAFDGLYFHLIKYKLHLQLSSQLEHKIHTARGFVFAGIGYLLFAVNSSGLLLYLACFLILIDMALEIIDIKVEKTAREPLGGIDSNESIIHVFASSFKFAAMILILLTKDAENFSIYSKLIQNVEMPIYFQVLSFGFIGTTLAVSTYSLMPLGGQSAIHRNAKAKLKQNTSSDVSVPFRFSVPRSVRNLHKIGTN